MRLINSDGQIVDARVSASDNASANRNSFHMDIGVMTLVSALAVMLVSVGISVWAMADSKGTRDLSDARDQAWHIAFEQQQAQARRTETESRVCINEYMEFRNQLTAFKEKINGR
jgi:hypothetical protein